MKKSWKKSIIVIAALAGMAGFQCSWKLGVKICEKNSPSIHNFCSFIIEEQLQINKWDPIGSIKLKICDKQFCRIPREEMIKMGIMADSLKYRYAFMIGQNVPEGYYQSVLMDIQKQENEAGGWDQIDFCYELINEEGGTYCIRERYKEKNHRWENLISLFTSYGFKPSDEDEDLIGLKELVYVQYNGNMGTLVERQGLEVVDIMAKDYQISFEDLEQLGQEEENDEDYES